MTLPDWLGEPDLAPESDESPLVETADDGQRSIRIAFPESESAPRLLQWDVELPETDALNRDLKLPYVPQAAEYDDLAALVPSREWILADRPPVAVKELPAEQRDVLTRWNAAATKKS